jgi:dihydrofolate reductase
MRKIVAGLFMSLDGVVEAPNDWAFQYSSDEMWAGIAAGVAQADAVLLGRRTYEGFASFWPTQGSDVPMSDFLNHSPKYVVSATLDTLAWANSTALTGDLADELATLTRQAGGNIQVPGSPTLVRSLLRDGLLDELSLNVCPIVVGSGMRLFDGLTAEVRLELVDSTSLSTGVVGLTYRPERA